MTGFIKHMSQWNVWSTWPSPVPVSLKSGVEVFVSPSVDVVIVDVVIDVAVTDAEEADIDDKQPAQISFEGGSSGEWVTDLTDFTDFTSSTKEKPIRILLSHIKPIRSNPFPLLSDTSNPVFLLLSIPCLAHLSYPPPSNPSSPVKPTNLSLHLIAPISCSPIIPNPHPQPTLTCPHPFLPHLSYPFQPFPIYQPHPIQSSLTRRSHPILPHPSIPMGPSSPVDTTRSFLILIHPNHF